MKFNFQKQESGMYSIYFFDASAEEEMYYKEHHPLIKYVWTKRFKIEDPIYGTRLVRVHVAYTQDEEALTELIMQHEHRPDVTNIP